MLRKDILMQVKELMERYHGNVNEIAAKLHMDPVTVQLWIDQINNMLS